MIRYEEYISTGLPWLRLMPTHWEIKRAKNMYQKEKRSVKPEDETITCFRDGIVTLRKNRRLTGFTESLKEIGYQGIRKGDLVIHVMDAFAGSIGVSDSDGKATPVYSVCTTKGDYNNHYYARLLREIARTGYIQSLYRGIRERSTNFSYDIFAAQSLVIPPREEQDHIVRWIDWKTSRISHYTRDKKREIECLRELKKAIVNEAVTKGGEDWETKSLRHLLQRATVKNRPEMPLLSVVRERGVIPRQLDKSENHNVIPGDLSGNLLLRKGQFVINKMKAWQGSCAVSELDGIVSPAYFVFDLRFENKTFFHYAIRSGYYTAKFAQVSKGIRSGQWDLPVQELNSIQFMYPPPDEQTRIVAYLDDQCAAIDAVTAKLMREIELLDEYKMSMISDAVTGKIDLRNVEIPDFEPEDEPINESEEGIENDDD